MIVIQPKRRDSLCGIRLVLLYFAVVGTAAFVLTLLDPSGPF